MAPPRLSAAEIKIVKEMCSSLSDTSASESDNSSTDSDGALISMLVAITKEIKELKKTNCCLVNEVNELKDEVVSLKETLAESKTANAPHSSAETLLKRSFADTVKSSVKSVLLDEKAKSDVIISGLAENKKDEEDIATLCTDANIAIKPAGLVRLGKVNDASTTPRLVKASFNTSFDARTFMARLDEHKKNTKDGFKKVKCRPSRSKDDQQRHNALSDKVYKMNKEASKKREESYSLRRNGEVWRFTKTTSGSWTRDSNWKFGTEQTQGNGSRTPVNNTPQEQRTASN